MTTSRLWPSTPGPSVATSYTLGSTLISGTTFFVTGEAWLEGYWWWVCNSGGQNTGATKAALWQIDPANTGGTGHLVPGSVTTSGTLTAGQWNYIPLATPIPLSLGGSAGASPKSAVAGVAGAAMYIAAIGCNGPFPDTPSYWGTSQPGGSGITNGPLTAYSAASAGLPAPYPSGGMPQGVFGDTGSTDPSVNCPEQVSGTDNFWVDVQVADYSGAPPGASLRLWPSFPVPVTAPNNDTSTAMTGTAFTLSRACRLDRIWLFSPAGATGLPTRTGIWNSGTQTEVPGTDNSSPTWSGAAGSGWIYVDYTSAGVTLPAASYIVSFYNGNGVKCYADSPNQFFSGTDPVGSAAVGGAGWNGISRGGGILTAPNVANGPLLAYDDSSGTKPGQTAYKPGPSSWAYPGEFEASSDWGETRWLDVEVTPVTASGPAPLMAGYI